MSTAPANQFQAYACSSEQVLEAIAKITDLPTDFWTLPISFTPPEGEEKKHAMLERNGEMVAVCATSTSGPRLLAFRKDRDTPSGIELIALLNAVGGTGSMVLPRALHPAAETANRALGGPPLETKMPLRLYRYEGAPIMQTDAALRKAGREDQRILVRWFDAFTVDTGLPPTGDNEERALASIEGGRMRILEVEEVPVACCQTGTPIAGQVRIGLVYVPDEHRRKGYATRLVRSVTAEALELGVSPCLFTDADNQATDALYRSIGYRPIDELLHLDPQKVAE